MKRIIKIMILISIMTLAIGCTNTSNKTNDKVMKVNITIIDNTTDKELYNNELDATGCNTLTELLNKYEKELGYKGEKQEYGTVILGLKDAMSNMDKGPWWIYSSDNNEVCLKMGMCPSADQTILNDNDNFVFTLTSEF